MTTSAEDDGWGREAVGASDQRLGFSGRYVKVHRARIGQPSLPCKYLLPLPHPATLFSVPPPPPPLPSLSAAASSPPPPPPPLPLPLLLPRLLVPSLCLRAQQKEPGSLPHRTMVGEGELCGFCDGYGGEGEGKQDGHGEGAARSEIQRRSGGGGVGADHHY